MALEPQQGLILIPSISGFTEFVSEVEISHSEHIITELAELLIHSNELELQLSELLGEAMLFYRQGQAPEIDAIMKQIVRWTECFHDCLNLLRRDAFCKCGACQNIAALGLHVVGHHGEFSVSTVNKRTIIIGKDVALAKQLRDNSVRQANYALLTSQLLAEAGMPAEKEHSLGRHRESYPVFGEVECSLLDLEAVREGLAPPSAREIELEFDKEFTAEIHVQAGLDAAAQTLSDIKGWPEWVDGLSHQELNPNEPLRVGHHHVCVLNGQRLEQTLRLMEEEGNHFQMVMDVKPLVPVLRNLMMRFQAQREDGGVLVSMSIRYTRKAVVGRIFDVIGLPGMKEHARRSLQNLKSLLETGAAENKAGGPATKS